MKLQQKVGDIVVGLDVRRRPGMDPEVYLHMLHGGPAPRPDLLRGPPAEESLCRPLFPTLIDLSPLLQRLFRPPENQTSVGKHRVCRSMDVQDRNGSSGLHAFAVSNGPATETIAATLSLCLHDIV